MFKKFGTTVLSSLLLFDVIFASLFESSNIHSLVHIKFFLINRLYSSKYKQNQKRDLILHKIIVEKQRWLSNILQNIKLLVTQKI